MKGWERKKVLSWELVHPSPPLEKRHLPPMLRAFLSLCCASFSSSPVKGTPPAGDSLPWLPGSTAAVQQAPSWKLPSVLPPCKGPGSTWVALGAQPICPAQCFLAVRIFHVAATKGLFPPNSNPKHPFINQLIISERSNFLI